MDHQERIDEIVDVVFKGDPIICFFQEDEIINNRTVTTYYFRNRDWQTLFTIHYNETGQYYAVDSYQYDSFRRIKPNK